MHQGWPLLARPRYRPSKLSIDDFRPFGEDWELATPKEKHEMLSCMFESLYPEFRTGQIVEVGPKPGFRWALERAGIAESPGKLLGDSSLVIADPEGDRGRQSLTAPRWGGLVLARPVPPQYLPVKGRTCWPARTRREARLIQLSFGDFEPSA
jgi:hypothetical protein